MNIKLTEQFLKDFSELSKSLQTKARALVKELGDIDSTGFRTRPMPGWRLHKLRDSPFCSLSLDMNFRILAKAGGDDLFLYRLVKHDIADSPHVNRNDSQNAKVGLTVERFSPKDLHAALMAIGVSKDKLQPLEGIVTEDELLESLDLLEQSYR